MLSALLLAILTPNATPSLLPLTAPTAIAADAEYEKRKNEAGKDTTKLWKLYEWCKEQKKEKEAKATLKAILKADPNHREANEASGNVLHDGKWFTSQKKVDEYKKTKEEEEARAKGLVSWKGQWVPAEDLPFLERGLTRDDSGNWISAEDAKKLAEGWVKQDLTWIDPKEKDKVAQGLWKCGAEWLPLDKADDYHNDLADWWQIPTDTFLYYTTIARDTLTKRVSETANYAYNDMAALFGVKPSLPPVLVLLRDAEQYGSYAAGSEEDERGPTEIEGLSSIHHAYFAELSIKIVDQEIRFENSGVGYWDAVAKDGDKWGVHSVRHAAAQSFVESLDPSPKWMDKVKKERKVEPKGFWEEKRLPRWYRYGACSYTERYFNDITVKSGGDKQWAKKWSVGNIQAKGGLRQLKQIFEFNLDAGMGPDGAKLLNEAGLLVAFIQDGNCAPVTEANKAFLDAFRAGKDKKALDPLARALETAIQKNEAALKTWAGL